MDRRVWNTLWIVVPALMAVVMSARGGTVEVVARGLPAAPVALATDERLTTPAGFFWQISSAPGERRYRRGDGQEVRVSARSGETLLWCRRMGDAVYSLTGKGPDRASLPCVIDPPFVLQRVPLGGGPAHIVRADLPSPSVFVMPSGAVCYADGDGIRRISPDGNRAALICRRANHHVTVWGASGETLYWIEEAMPGSRDPVGSCRLMALAPGEKEPRTVAWAPDALTDLVVSERIIAWYHPAGRALEGVRPDGRVTVLARDVNLAATPMPVGDRLYYLCERRGGARELAVTSIHEEGRDTLARLDASARLLGVAAAGLYLGEEERGRSWFPAVIPAARAAGSRDQSPVTAPRGRLLRVPLP